jgi:hypothetical protein
VKVPGFRTLFFAVAARQVDDPVGMAADDAAARRAVTFAALAAASAPAIAAFAQAMR